MNETLVHHKRVVDSYLTSLSILRDRYEGRANFIDSVQLVLSFLIAARLFVDPNFLAQLRISPSVADLLVRIASLTMFCSTLIVLRLDIKGRAAQYRLACENLGKLKVELADFVREGTSDSAKIREMERLCRTTLSSLPRIPDRQFVKLKAKHLQKRALSKAIEQTPFIPVWYVRSSLAIRHMKRMKGDAKNEGNGNGA